MNTLRMVLVGGFLTGCGAGGNERGNPPSSSPSPSSEDSPFGFLPARVAAAGYEEAEFAEAQAIGVRWHRSEVPVFWFRVQSDLDEPVYDWSVHDELFREVPQDIRILVNISADDPRNPHGYARPGSYLPIDEDRYRTFVRALVERYDGDGLDDMPGLTNPVLHWQVDNEPAREFSDFADLQRITYEAAKEACPDCTILIGGAAGMPTDYIRTFDEVYEPILARLAGKYVDVFDFHWYGTASGDYLMRDSGQDVLDHIRSTLATYGFDLPIWITEMGTYSGNPAEEAHPPQTERQQAIDLFKRYVYSLSRGVRKVFSAFGLMEGFKRDDSYFDHTGLIYDGRGADDLGLGVEKLGYFTYQLMTQKLRGATPELLREGASYLFRLRENSYIAWADGEPTSLEIRDLISSTVTVTPVVTSDLPFSQQVTDGAVIVRLGDSPVIID